MKVTTLQEKKIVLIGPMATGKTTFKRVFFEDANPLELLNHGLEPTRGIETDTYKHLTSTIAVWDLAGQENDAWMDEKSDVFQESNAIVCMMTCTQQMKDILLFLIKVLNKWKEMENQPKLYLLLHKCDLVAESESYNMVLTIEQYMAKKHPEFSDICKRTNIFRTSIAAEYFLRTLMIAYEIMGTCIDKQGMKVTNDQMKEIKAKINLLLAFEVKKWYTADMFGNMPSGNNPQFLLEDLRSKGYLINEREKFYSLSEKGEYFSRAWSRQGSIAKTKQAMQKVGFFLDLNANLEKIGR